MTQVGALGPNVYVREVSSGVRPIRGVATSIAAFVDFFSEGPMNEAGRILGISDANRIYGGLHQDSEASYHIQQFFLNGGSMAYVVRVASDGEDVEIASGTEAETVVADSEVDLSSETPDLSGVLPGDTITVDGTEHTVVSFVSATTLEVTPAPAADASGLAWSITIENKPTSATQGIVPPASTSDPALIVSAANEGTWGNAVRLEVTPVDDAGTITAFDMSVLRYDGIDGSARVVSTEGPFLSLSVDSASSRYVADVIAEESSLISVTHDGSSTDVPHATGTLGTALDADLDTGATAPGTLAIDISDAFGDAVVEQHTASFPDSTGATLNQLRRIVEQTIRASTPMSGGTTSSLLGGATVKLVGRRLLVRLNQRAGDYEPSLTVTFSDAKAAQLGLDAATANVQQYVLGARPVASQLGGTRGALGVVPNQAALNGDPGEPDPPTGMYALNGVDLFNLLSIPRAADLDDAERLLTYDNALKYCQDKRAMLLVDIPEDVDTVDDMEDWLDNHASLRDKNAVVYFPRLLVADPLNDYRERNIGSSGTIAGIYSRNDATNGVWKSPGGVDMVISGITGLDVVLTDAQNGILNPLAGNCLRSFPIYGSVVWGARTLEGTDLSEIDWRYLGPRRLALFLEETLYRATKWAVFANNDEPLWSTLRQNITAFMMTLFRQGAFQGDTPSKAFFVKCDGETTTAADRNLGIVNIQIGFSALKPAEFIVITIQQIPDTD